MFKHLLIILNISFINTVLYDSTYHYHHYDDLYSPTTFDHWGNCYMTTEHIKGRCVSEGDCGKYQQYPFICYNNNNYENLVCCPEAYITTQPSLKRKSVEKCHKIYNNLDYQRLKRNEKLTKNDPLDDNEVQEEIVKRKQISETQAVGGTPTSRNEFPYMCALGWRMASYISNEISYHCGCVLVDRKYVLTAAHCASLGGEPPEVVLLGGNDLDDIEAETIQIQQIIQHPNYKAQQMYNDIAIVKLLIQSSHTPACLWPYKDLTQQTLIAIGYGQTKFAGPTSNTLLKVYLNEITNQDCNAYYRKEEKLKQGIQLGHICAIDTQAKMDTCQGDSGGPLLMLENKFGYKVPYVVGLTSFGDGCATYKPGVYTRISYFIEWIEDIVWP
ncbi:hypothetical protein DOY81_002665 [Sarcophaga bullata]|nr:hypothetical protein DOY81_002665 [Sarcophaga bullata]